MNELKTNAVVGSEVDLLGLGSLSPVISTQSKTAQPSGDNLLVDILGTNGTTENGTMNSALLHADLSAAAMNKKEFVK